MDPPPSGDSPPEGLEDPREDEVGNVDRDAIRRAVFRCLLLRAPPLKCVVLWGIGLIYCHVDRDASLSVHILLLHHYKSDFAHISDLYSLVIGLYKSVIRAKDIRKTNYK